MIHTHTHTHYLLFIKFVSGRYTRHGKPRGFNEFKKTMTHYKSDASCTCIDTVTSWNAKGKFIWLELDNGLNQTGSNNDNADIDIDTDTDFDFDPDYLRSIWITLGMSGRFVSDAFNRGDDDDGTTHKQARWYFEFLDERSNENTTTSTSTCSSNEDEERKPRRIYYYDTRNFGTLRFSLSKKELEEKLSSLGPDILGGCTEEIFLDIMSKQRQTTNICKFLMNQSVSS